MKNWLVVANASSARVLEESAPGAYAHVADLVHPESRQKGSELSTDRPGHAPGVSAHGTGSTSYDSRTDPREREHDRFARELANTVNSGIASGRCAGLILVASAPFIGHVKQHLSEQAGKALLRSVTADYTTLNEQELAHRLAGSKP